MNHPDINRIERIGFPNIEYLEWELRLEQEEIVEDEEWPDGMTYEKWQKKKTLQQQRANRLPGQRQTK